MDSQDYQAYATLDAFELVDNVAPTASVPQTIEHDEEIEIWVFDPGICG